MKRAVQTDFIQINISMKKVFRFGFFLFSPPHCHLFRSQYQLQISSDTFPPRRLLQYKFLLLFALFFCAETKEKSFLRLRKSQFSRLMLTKTSEVAWELTHFSPKLFFPPPESVKYLTNIIAKSLFQKSFIVIAFGCFSIRAFVCADIFAIKTKFQIHQSPYIINKNNATSGGR